MGAIEIVPACAAPVPVNVTFCGLPVALSATFKVAVRVPLVAGVNSTLIWQYAPPASVPVGLHIVTEFGKGTPKSPAFVPVTVNPEKLTVAVLVFVTVTLIGELVVPTISEANVKLAGDTVTAGVVLAPVPVSGTVCGLPVALSAMLMEAERPPAAVGVKVTLIEQLAAAASEAGHVLV